MANNEQTVKEPLFHITRRTPPLWWQSLLLRVVAVFVGLIIGDIIICMAAGPRSDGNFFSFFGSLFTGVFSAGATGEFRNFWNMLRDASLLLGVSLALVPAFKMKFWNLGGNGQVLIGCLAAISCMYYLGGVLPDLVVWLFMILSSVVCAGVWALIPAIFKALFKTNESLFTLMLNYIAAYLVTYFVAVWYPGGTGAMPSLDKGGFPTFGDSPMGKALPVVLVIAIVTAVVFVYLKYTKQGYEISIVGDSENTARYASINVKAVIIRTVIISGAICGLVGCLLAGSINHMITSSMDGNRGFTGIMVAWLGNFEPLLMLPIAFLISFLNYGMGQVRLDFAYKSDVITEIVLGIIYLLLIAVTFFVTYKVNVSSALKEKFGKLFKVKNSKEDK